MKWPSPGSFTALDPQPPSAIAAMTFRRILLKISGEMLLGTAPFGIDQEACLQLAAIISQLQQQGVQIALVLGGGNIYRGVALTSLGVSRTPADQMGMLATLMNGLALQQALKKIGSAAALISALECPQVAQSYHWQTAMELLEKGSIAIFVGGTGHPYFTTDTAAALRACQIEADVLIKATNVDGVYPADPRHYPNLPKYDTISYSEVLAKGLGVMDASAVAMCRDQSVPILVLNKAMLRSKNLMAIVEEGQVGTLIHGD